MKQRKPVPQEKKEKIVADWRTGNYSQRELSDRHKVSVGLVANLTKGVEQDVSAIVSAGVQYRQGIAEFSEQSAHIAHSIESAVDERVRHLQFFTDAAVRNVKASFDLPCESQRDIKDRAETILKGKEVVLGKTPDTAIQINNEAQQPKLEVVLAK